MAAPPGRSVGAVIGTHANNFNLVRLFLSTVVLFFHSFHFGTGQMQAAPFDQALLDAVGLDYGGLAVDAFFFLSGLFVTQSLWRDRSAINFVIRRFCRIWPGLFVCLALTALLGVIAGHGWATPAFLLQRDYYAYVLNNAAFKLTWSIPGVFDGTDQVINGSIHTLPTEIKMYVGLLLIGLVTIRSRVATGLAAVAVVAVVVAAFETIRPWTWLPDYALPPTAMFFLGVALFTVADRVRVRAWHIAPLLLVAAMAPPAWNTAAALAATAVTLLVLGQAPMRWRPTTDISYGVYIYGWPSQQLVLSQVPGIDPYVLFGLALPLSLGFAALSWRLVEGPAIAFGQGLVRSRRQAGTVGATAAMRRLWVLPGAKAFGATCLGCLGLCAVSWGVSARLAAMPALPLGTAITGFGPTETPAGASFNVQPSGSSAVWVAFDKRPPDGTHILFDGQPLPTVLTPNAATAIVPPAAVTTPGDKPILLELREENRWAQSAPVMLHVTP